MVPFYTSLNADISRSRKDIKRQPTVFFPVFLVPSDQKIKILISYFISTFKRLRDRSLFMTRCSNEKK